MANAQQIRHAADSGEARDKVAGPDLAAAPLGTDDEAAGQRGSEEPQAPPAGDAVAAGDPSVGDLYAPQCEEDNRAPAEAPPNWRMWGLIAAGLVGMAVLAAVMAA